jgi:signal transduction histidine kinase
MEDLVLREQSSPDGHARACVAAGLGTGAAGAAFAVAGMSLAARHDPHPWWIAVPVQGVGIVVLGVGVLLWVRHPDGLRMGRLLAAVGVTWYIGDLQYCSDPVLYRFGFWFFHVNAVVLTQVLLSYPDGRLARRAERVTVAAAYVVVTVTQGMRLLTERPLGLQTHGRQREYWEVPADDVWATLGSLLAIAVTAAAIVLVLRRWRAEPPPVRRSRGLYWAAVVTIGAVIVLSAAAAMFAPTGVQSVLLMVYSLAVLMLGAAVLTGVLHTQLGTQQRVARLLSQLHARPVDATALHAALSEALGDPRLGLLFRRADSGDYVDTRGHPVPVPADDRGVTVVHGADRRPLAVLVHDPVLLSEPQFRGRLRAVVAATSLAIENARLHVENRAHLRGLLDIEHATRRRIRSTLHDGPQNRLSALQLLLGRVDRRGGTGRLDTQLRQISDELQEAVRDLRNVTEGIYPAHLSRAGLRGALDPLAQRSPVPLVLDVDASRWPADLERTAFFVISEAVGNAHKHSGASRVTVRVRAAPGRLVLEVADDGAGTAEPSPTGSGLRGMRDRVAAHHGRLTVTSIPGGGTTVRAVLPCE